MHPSECVVKFKSGCPKQPDRQTDKHIDRQTHSDRQNRQTQNRQKQADIPDTPSRSQAGHRVFGHPRTSHAPTAQSCHWNDRQIQPSKSMAPCSFVFFLISSSPPHNVCVVFPPLVRARALNQKTKMVVMGAPPSLLQACVFGTPPGGKKCLRQPASAGCTELVGSVGPLYEVGPRPAKCRTRGPMSLRSRPQTCKMRGWMTRALRTQRFCDGPQTYSYTYAPTSTLIFGRAHDCWVVEERGSIGIGVCLGPLVLTKVVLHEAPQRAPSSARSRSRLALQDPMPRASAPS